MRARKIKGREPGTFDFFAFLWKKNGNRAETTGRKTSTGTPGSFSGVPQKCETQMFPDPDLIGAGLILPRYLSLKNFRL